MEMPNSGVPDRKTAPSAMLHYDVKYKIINPTPVGADTTWHCDIQFRPDPLCFGAYYRCSASEFAEPITRIETMTSGLSRYFLNTQVSGTGGTPELAYAAKYTFWKSNVKQYRVVYAGATLTTDAPTLSDQGTISAAQYPVFEKPYSIPAVDYTAPAHNYASRGVKVWESGIPTFDALQNMPGVYTAKAKDGCYLPLKLAPSDFEFKSSGDACYAHSDRSGGAVADGVLAVDATTGLSDPYVPCADVYMDAATGLPTGDLMLKPSTHNVGHIAVRGISNSAALYVQFRVGYELLVMPGSTYSPNLSKLVEGDPVAMESYFEISRRLADAYPESYNSLGAILPIIGSLASQILPTLAPVAGKALKSIGSWLGESQLTPEEKEVKVARRKAKKLAKKGGK